jgi:hypothetical protein
MAKKYKENFPQMKWQAENLKPTTPKATDSTNLVSSKS